ncbi:unnamed protein product [Lupinus luteus]|uniref:HHO5-like N-terminal domain-containing protein n=1 Tax=Lupinus luteus TaxID=3873 RepID=A0AAV1WWV3_LUPLU
MELSLDLSLAFVPRTISELLSDVSAEIKVGSHKMAMLDDYVKRLENEMRKIEAFKRELPQCMLIVNQVFLNLNDKLLCVKSIYYTSWVRLPQLKVEVNKVQAQMKALMIEKDKLQTFTGNVTFHSFENAKEQICLIHPDDDLSWMSIGRLLDEGRLFFDKADGSLSSCICRVKIYNV